MQAISQKRKRMAELKLTDKDIKLILKGLLTGQFDLYEQNDAFDRYRKLISANVTKS